MQFTSDRRLGAAVLAVVMFISCGGHLAAGAGPELAPNGGFETPGATDANAPAGWTARVHGKTTATWAAEGARTGRRCLRMTADPNEKWGHAYWTSSLIAVRPCMAYRVRFHFRSKGHGVPCFTLIKVKNWRLFKGGTGAEWIAHEDVVVVPADVTETRFSVNNYHRPGKTMWLDDLSIVELPLSDSPLTKRLSRARRSVAAIERNAATLRLAPGQKAELREMRRSLATAEAAYARLAKGAAAAADFRAMDAGVGAVEKALGAYLLTVWVAAGDPTGAGRPTGVARTAETTLRAGPEGARCVVGAMALVDEPLPVRVSLAGDRKTRDWRLRLLLAPASHPGQWGQMNSLGTLLLPPGAPRLLTVEIEPVKAKPGTYAVHLDVACLDRPAAPGRITLNVIVPGK